MDIVEYSKFNAHHYTLRRLLVTANLRRIGRKSASFVVESGDNKTGMREIRNDFGRIQSRGL